MRVLIVGDYPPPYGGSSVQVWVLHRLLSARPGCSARVLDIGTTRRQRRPECLPARNAAEFAWRLLSHAARRYILHLHTNGHNLKSWLVILAGSAAGLLNRGRTVVSIGSGLAPEFIERSGRFRRLLVRVALRRMGAVICRNERARTTILRLGIPERKVAIVPGFYGVRTFEPAAIPEPVQDFLGAHGVVVAAIASSGPEYGIPLLLEAARRLRPRHPRLGVLLIGPEHFTGDGLDGDLLAAGELPHDVVLAIMPRISVFVRPTYFDGDASSVREALALGTRVVASDTDFRPDGVVRFRRGNVEDLISKLESVLQGGRPAETPMPPTPSSAFQRLVAIYERLGPAGPAARGLA